eukprot:gene25170-10800_t
MGSLGLGVGLGGGGPAPPVDMTGLMMQRPDYPFPRSAVSPGKVVWAKVEGHDWWPAKVVRRRAVPREVNPPPGGPQYVLLYIPVVFFTAEGIPAEVDECLDSAGGMISAGIRAIRNAIEEPKESDEAEYAWLPVDCLKPFKLGDVSGTAGAPPSGDPDLKAAISAAEMALRNLLVTEAAAAGGLTSGDDLALSGSLPDELAAGGFDGGYDSDSDGGWGIPSPQKPSSILQGGGRGKGGLKKLKGKGTRKGGGRGSDNCEAAATYAGLESASSMLVPSSMLEGPDTAPTGASVRKVVECIMGWRYAPSAEQKREERAATLRVNHQRAQILQDLRATLGRGPPSKLKSKVQQASRELLASRQQPASNACIGGAGGEREFLVKWLYKSHVHDEWLLEEVLISTGVTHKQVGNAEWKRPEKVVARRPCPTSPGWEVLVKWQGLDYQHSTWEAESEMTLIVPDHLPLHFDMWERQRRAVLRCRPAYVKAGALQWMQGMWAKEHHCVLADDAGLGKTASVVTFLHNLITQGRVCRPILVIAPQARLRDWEAEWTYWSSCMPSSAPASSSRLKQSSALPPLPAKINVITYSGALHSRACLFDHEVWLNPSALDSKACIKKVPKVDVLLASYEALQHDLPSMGSVKWEALVMDLRGSQDSMVEALQHDLPSMGSVKWEALVMDLRRSLELMVEAASV